MARFEACATCLDTKGLCDGEDRMKSFFAVKLRHDFVARTVIPCYTRARFLQQYGVDRSVETTFVANLSTKEGFEFGVTITNKPGLSYVTGRIWKEFARVYNLQAGDEIYFSLAKPGLTIRVTTGRFPIIHPIYYHLSPEKREIIDKITTTEGTVVSWKMMHTVISHVDDLDLIVAQNGGDYRADWSAYALVHTLTKSNCKKNYVKLPKRVTPKYMDKSGDITIVCHPNTRVSSTYSISLEDGRLCVNKWDIFMEKEKKLVIGKVLLLMLYFGDNGTYLFVSDVSKVDA